MVRSARNVLIAALALMIFAVLLVLVFWVALWLAIVAALLLAIVLLHVLVLPRLAARVGLSTQVLILLLLPPLAGLGWLVARNPLGVAAGLAVWVGAFALPRFAVASSGNRSTWKIEFHFGEAKKAPAGPGGVPAGFTCQRCGMVVPPPPNGGAAKCPRCGTEQTRRNLSAL